MGKVIVLWLMLLSIGAQAQVQRKMTPEKLKKANVVVLSDSYSGIGGNIIILRLRDKDRANKSANSVNVSERTPAGMNSYSVLIDDNLEISSDEISVMHFGGNSFAITRESDGLFFSAYDLSHIEEKRDYKIVAALFYNRYTDVFSGSTLGEEYDLDAAFKYMAQMFKIYE